MKVAPVRLHGRASQQTLLVINRKEAVVLIAALDLYRITHRTNRLGRQLWADAKSIPLA